MRAFIPITLLLLTCVVGCRQDEIVPQRFYPRNDHEAYWYSLKQANLLTTALGKEWLEAADRPFDEQIEVQIPYQEAFELSDRQADAFGYRFDVNRGQKVLINLELAADDSAAVFIDLFRVENDSLKDFRHVASADSAYDLAFEPRKDASYLLRLQPELLRGGLFTISIETVPSLDFPVAGKDRRAIQSFFGDPRDGGKRKHHGVDIFAKRHTAILAPTDGRIRSVETKKLGGKVVWLYDSERGAHLYFAHLEEQLVSERQVVKKGDTLGTVGNTGNARYTPPHLHFGIYRRGPINPYYFLVPQYDRAGTFEADTSLLGKDVAIAKEAFLKSAMDRTSANLDTLAADSPFHIVAVNHRFVRVVTNDGQVGFVEKAVL